MSPSVLWVLALASLAGCMAADLPYYKGAVVDYNFILNSSAPRDTLMANVRNFETFIKMAANYSADIIVFPEGALLAGDQTIFMSVPNPADKVTPAGNSTWDRALQSLSSFANNSKIYVVVNLHENYTDPSSNATLKYNTNVVFDRNGTVISRYRKYNLFNEDLNITKEPEYATFDTDFGVTFGQFICFDILFKEPALNLVKDRKIKNFVYPTWWFSELPFLTAAQAQWSWAVGNNVNLLAAGVNDVSSGSAGSSIIPGRSPYWGSGNFVFSNKTGSTLIVARIPKDPSTSDSSFTGQVNKTTVFNGGDGSFFMLTQPGLENFTSKELELWTNQTSRRFTEQVCHGKFCCNFDLNITYENTLNDTIKYKTVAYSGDRIFGSRNPSHHGIEICGVYAYNNSSPNSLDKLIFGPLVRKVTFTNVKISGNFRVQNSEILPNVLLHPGANEEFLPAPSDVTLTTGDTSVLVWNPQKPIITVGIHSRLFKNAATLAQISTFAMLLPVMVAVLMSIKKYY